MSRIGREPITVPAGVDVKMDGNVLTVKGPLGTLTQTLRPEMKVEVDAGTIKVTRPNDEANMRSLHGLTRTLINNMSIGVSEGYQKELEINGTGYRASVKNGAICMFLGYSHEIRVEPVGKFTKITCPDDTHVVVEGCDKHDVGQTAALIYDSHRPDGYGQKGVHYKGQHLIKKVGKRAAATGAKK